MTITFWSSDNVTHYHGFVCGCLLCLLSVYMVLWSFIFILFTLTYDYHFFFVWVMIFYYYYFICNDCDRFLLYLFLVLWYFIIILFMAIEIFLNAILDMWQYVIILAILFIGFYDCLYFDFFNYICFLGFEILYDYVIDCDIL